MCETAKYLLQNPHSPYQSDFLKQFLPDLTQDLTAFSAEDRLERLWPRRKTANGYQGPKVPMWTASEEQNLKVNETLEKLYGLPKKELVEIHFEPKEPSLESDVGDDSALESDSKSDENLEDSDDKSSEDKSEDSEQKSEDSDEKSEDDSEEKSEDGSEEKSEDDSEENSEDDSEEKSEDDNEEKSEDANEKSSESEDESDEKSAEQSEKPAHKIEHKSEDKSDSDLSDDNMDANELSEDDNSEDESDEKADSSDLSDNSSDKSDSEDDSEEHNWIDVKKGKKFFSQEDIFGDAQQLEGVRDRKQVKRFQDEKFESSYDLDNDQSSEEVVKKPRGRPKKAQKAVPKTGPKHLPAARLHIGPSTEKVPVLGAFMTKEKVAALKTNQIYLKATQTFKEFMLRGANNLLLDMGRGSAFKEKPTPFLQELETEIHRLLFETHSVANAEDMLHLTYCRLFFVYRKMVWKKDKDTIIFRLSLPNEKYNYTSTATLKVPFATRKAFFNLRTLFHPGDYCFFQGKVLVYQLLGAKEEVSFALISKLLDDNTAALPLVFCDWYNCGVTAHIRPFVNLIN